jgi:hypothetical protein
MRGRQRRGWHRHRSYRSISCSITSLNKTRLAALSLDAVSRLLAGPCDSRRNPAAAAGLTTSSKGALHRVEEQALAFDLALSLCRAGRACTPSRSSVYWTSAEFPSVFTSVKEASHVRGCSSQLGFAVSGC